jgi:hypothetical protein
MAPRGRRSPLAPIAAFVLLFPLCSGGAAPGPRVGISADRFTIDGRPTFLLGASYFDVLGYKESDLDGLAARGFNLVRIWLDWAGWEDRGRSCFDPDGNLVHASAVLGFARAAAARGMLVDVTVLSSASGFTDFAAVKRAVRSAVRALAREPNVFFDLVNEHNNRGLAGSWWSVPHARMKELVAAARAENPSAILTFSSSSPHLVASDGSVSAKELREEIEAGSELVAVHLPRTPDWHLRTGERVLGLRAALAAIGVSVPVYLQEENRRGFEGHVSSAGDFLEAARRARDAGAAGFVFHTAAGFDLSGEATFFGNLDSEERAALDALGASVLGP